MSIEYIKCYIEKDTGKMTSPGMHLHTHFLHWCVDFPVKMMFGLYNLIAENLFSSINVIAFIWSLSMGVAKFYINEK